MPSSYLRFRPHLDLAHQYWKQLIHPGDFVIDATCGNGQDTLKLCQLVIHADQGRVYACDIQPKALELTRQYLASHLSPQQLTRVYFVLGCHSQFPQDIQPHTIKLIVYNLGYLPRGNKDYTTKTETTLQSLYQAQDLIMPGGAISLTCYPGHEEGSREENALMAFATQLSPKEWICCFHRWLNRHNAPSLLLLQKRGG